MMISGLCITEITVHVNLQRPPGVAILGRKMSIRMGIDKATVQYLITTLCDGASPSPLQVERVGVFSSG